MSKPLYVEWAPVFSALILVVGRGMLAGGSLSLIGKMLVGLGSWAYWVAFIGFFVFLTGAIWLWMFVSSARKFNKALEEKSKAVFLKSMDDTEYLAWKLPSRYEERLAAKKKELGIR